MKCVKCGAEIADDFKFCPKCGTPAEAVARAAEADEEFGQAEEVENTSADGNDETTEKVERVEKGELGDNVVAEKNTDITSDSEMDRTVDKVDTIVVDKTEEIETTGDSLKSTDKPRKAHSTVLIIIIAAIAILIILAICFAGRIKLLLAKPSTLFEDALISSTESALNDYGAFYEDYYIKSLESVGNTASAYDAKIALSDDAKSLISTYSAATGYDFSWLSDIELSGTAGISGENAGTNLFLGLNGSDILAAKLILDCANENMYLAIPTISEKYLGVALDNYADKSLSDALAETISQSAELAAAAPDTDTLKEISSKYIKIAVADLDEVTKGSETLTVEDVSKKYTTLTATVSNKAYAQMALDLATAAKDDENLKPLMELVMKSYGTQLLSEEYGIENFDDFYAQFQTQCDDIIEQAQAELDQLNADESLVYQVATIVLYVDSASDIAGLHVYNENTDLYYYNPTDGRDFAKSLGLSSDGSAFDITGKGLSSGDIKNADYTITENGATLATVSIADLDENKLKKGEISGEFIITPTSQLVENYLGLDTSVSSILANATLDITVNAVYDDANYTVAITSGGLELAAVDLSLSQIDELDIATPDSSSVCLISDDYTPLMDYCYSTDFSSLTAALTTAGIPDEYVALVEEIGGYITSGDIISLYAMLYGLNY